MWTNSSSTIKDVENVNLIQSLEFILTGWSWDHCRSKPDSSTIGVKQTETNAESQREWFHGNENLHSNAFIQITKQNNKIFTTPMSHVARWYNDLEWFDTLTIVHHW